MRATQHQNYSGRGVNRTSYRKRVTAAFRARMHAVDAGTAHAHTKAFYRSGGAEWTRGFS